MSGCPNDKSRVLAAKQTSVYHYTYPMSLCLGPGTQASQGTASSFRTVDGHTFPTAQPSSILSRATAAVRQAVQHRLPTALLLAALLLSLVLMKGDLVSQPLMTETLDVLPLAGHLRLLVLAPHCDDETLGAGGLILAAQRMGMQVRVVIATNGDGYVFATMEDFRRAFPRSGDFVRMGELRQQESLRALGLLGVPEAQVTFLSYPDGGTPSLWGDHWSAQTPYRSPYSGTRRSPYPVTYDQAAVYAGADLLHDLVSILRSYSPDLIVYPHPNDVHPDHWGLSVFTRLALAQVQRENPAYHPDSYVYLIHRPDFPVPAGQHPNASLVPPTALRNLPPHWFRLDLSAEETAQKWQALQAYSSQVNLLRDLFEGLVRANELFGRLDSIDMPQLAEGDPVDPHTWHDPSGAPIPPVQLDPTGDAVVREAVSAADLSALYAGETSDGLLCICAQTRGRASRDLAYVLQVRAASADGTTLYTAHWGRISQREPHIGTANGHFVCAQVSATQLGNPWLVFVNAWVHGLSARALDQTAWQLLNRGAGG
jgi:LmbE family N-acetylglucosaminyl deacetylase